VPQVSVGSVSNHPTRSLHIPHPIHLLKGPGPNTGSGPDVPDLLAIHQIGVTQTAPCATHPVHLWLSGPASAVEAGVRGVAGMARFSAAGPTGLRRDHCRDRPWQVVIARPGRENMQRHHTQETREANPQDQESPVQQVCGT